MKLLTFKKYLFFLTVAVMAFGLWNCSVDKNPLPSKAHTSDWNDPESENFHGLKVVELGEKACKSCHGQDFTGGESKVSCFSCHASYPHLDEWMVISSAMFHGAALKNNNWDTESCADCHGKDFQGGESKVSCYQCHKLYPHQQGWVKTDDANFHGTFVSSNDGDTKACESCHGEDSKGGSSGVSCFTCHDNFPHPADWANKDSQDFHGLVLATSSWDATMCAGCHGDDFQGGTSNISCFSCHSTFPHNANWLTSGSDDFHGAVVKNNNWQTSDCASCHGEDFRGGSTQISCYTCHENYPHNQDWNNSTSDQFHGSAVRNDAWNTTTCASCHGEDFLGGSSEISCYTCHETFPHKSDWADKNAGEYHGAYLKANDWDATSCTSCHGEGYTGGSTNVSCFTCHSTFPHPAGWLNISDPEFHGKALQATDWDVSSCADCHGQDYMGGTAEVSCFTCHNAFPHNANWLNPSSDDFHGAYLKNNNWKTEACAVCHGQDYQGGDVGVSCYTCHSSFPHATNWLNSSSEEFHGNFIRQSGWTLAQCQTCHGEDYSGGDTGKACTLCHTQEGGPEACNTCHGNADHIYPPRDLNNNTATTALGVGAHEKHMEDFACELCHVVPATFDDPSHIDGLPADVKSNWQWDRNTGTCAASCHGASKIWNHF